MKMTLAALALLFLVTGTALAAESAAPAELVSGDEAKTQVMETLTLDETENASTEAPIAEPAAQCSAALTIPVLESTCNAPGWCDSPDDFCGCIYSGGRRGYCARAYC